MWEEGYKVKEIDRHVFMLPWRLQVVQSRYTDTPSTLAMINPPLLRGNVFNKLLKNKTDQ